MLYLEDYLEMIEHLPQELRDRFTEMRELDLAVQNNMDSLEKKTRFFFLQCKRGELENEAADNEYENLRKEYYKVLEDADEKVTIATQIHELVERYLRRLDSELFKFKCELEADNNGITEILEKRSLEMDGASSAATALMNVIGMNQKENRYFGGSMGFGANFGASNSHAVVGGHGLSSMAVAQPKDNRYRTTTRPEKRRDSSTSSITGAPTEKRPNLGIGLTPTNAAVRPITPSMGTLAVLSPAVGSVASPVVAPVAYNLQQMAGASATNSFAAVAGQAIATTTHQLQQGRRAASMKASYEAIHGVGGGPTEFWISRDIASAATAAQNSQSEKKQKKKSNLNLSNVGVAMTNTVSSSAMSLLSSSSSMSLDSMDMLPSSSAAVTGVGANLGLSILGSSTSSASAAASRSNVASTSAAAAAAAAAAASINNVQLNENGLAMEQMPEGDWQYDPNEPRYCTCNQVSYGDMVACDNDACPYEWFHYPCVGITQPPKGKWYCPKCTASMRRRGNRKN